MATSSLALLAGLSLVDDGAGTTVATGAIPVYQSDGKIVCLGIKSPAGTSGLAGRVERLPLMLGRTGTGLTMTASAGAGVFGISNTTATSRQLSGEAANNNTKTDKVLWEYQVPSSYVAGQNLTITVNSNLTLNSGTNGASTILANAYLLADAGTSGATLVATAAASPTTTKTDYAFVVTGTTVTPGATLLIEVIGVTIESAAGGGIVQTLNSVRIS